MAFNIEVINKSIRLYVLILLLIPTIVTSNIDCGRKPFHCVNATHFMICVDLGGGISRTIDNYVYECPSPTECQPSNSFECEFPEATTQPSRVSDVTNELLVNNNTTLRSEDTIVTISPLTNTSQAIQPEAILTIDVTSTATTNSYKINDHNITDNASNHTDGLLINFSPSNMDEKTDVLNNDIITNVTTTLPVDSMSSSTNMSTEESTTNFTIYITSEDMVNGTASTNNILGIENVTETTERVNSSTDQVTSSTFLILNETNSKTDSLSTDTASSTTSGDVSNATTIDIPPKGNTNKSVVSGDALDITNNTENIFSTQSEVSPNTFVTLSSGTASSEGILTTLVITEGTAITVSTDKSATDNQFEYESSATPKTNNITETNATTDGLTSFNGITGEVATTTSPTLQHSKKLTAIVEPNNFPIDSVTSNNVETNQITEATTFSTDGLPSTFAYQFEHNTDKNYTSNNIGNNKTVSKVDETPKDNINKSNVSSSALEMKNKSENLLPSKPEVTLPSVVVSNESTITTNESSASTAYNQSEGEGTAITKNISEYYSTSAPSTLTSKIGATDAIEMTTAPLITDIKNDVTTIGDSIDLRVESVTSNNDNVNKDVITKVTDGASVATDESIRSTMDHIFEVTTRKYDVSNNFSHNNTVSTIDEHPKHNANKSEATNNAIKVENRTENVLFTSPEGVLSNISAIFPSVTVSIEGPKITLVTTEATEIITSANNNSASTPYNQSEAEATAIINNISEYYSTSEPSTLTSKIGATDAIEMTTAPLITDTKNAVTAKVEPIYLSVDSVTSNNDNVNKDVITKVTDGASLSTDESIRSTMNHSFEVTTRKYDVHNNITNNKTVSTIDEHPKHNANKSDVTNNAIEIENSTENVIYTSPEGVLSNMSGTFPSETVSSEGTIITLVTTEATEIITSADNNLASTIYNRNENKSSASAINNNFSEHFSTTEALILTSKTADTSANKTTIADTKNDITPTVDPFTLPIDLVTSYNVNENKDEVNQFNVSTTVSRDQSVRSTTDFLFEVTTNKYDISDTITNNKTMSTIEVQPEDTLNKTEVSNKTTEIGNRTENGLIIESEAASSNISSSLTPVATSDDATASTAVVTEGTTITISIDENLLTVTVKQPEENTSVTDVFNNITVTNFTTENITSTSQSVTAGPIETIASSTTKNESPSVQPITLPTVTSNDANANKDVIISVIEATAVSTDQGIRSTIDTQFQVSTIKHDTKVNNNKTVSTIDEKLKSNVSNSAIESKNRTENLLPSGSEVALPIITVTVPSVGVPSESTTPTDVITDGIVTTIYTNNNPASNMDKQPGHEISATTIINKISETNSTLDGITLTTKTNEYKMTTDSIIAPTKNVTPDAEPIALPTDSVTSLNSKQDVLSTIFSKDQSLSSTLDYEFEPNTNKTENVNNKTLSTIDGNPQDTANKADDSTNAKEIKNQTEKSLLTGAEDTLSNILITSPSGAAASESTITTVLEREGTDIPMSTEKNLASSIGKQPEDNGIVTDIFTNITATNLTAENVNSSSQKVTADPIETITVPIIAFAKDEEAIIEPITLPIASVTSNYGNGNQDILITVTETTVISNDQTTRSIDYKFEENTNQYNIPYNANNKSENSPTTVLDLIYLNSIDTNEAVNISNGKVTEKPTGLPLHSITLPLVEAPSEGIMSAAVDDTKNTPIFESKQDTTIDRNPEFKMPESPSSNNKLQTETNNLQSTEIQGISIPSMKQATDIVYDLTGGAEILLESPTLSTVSPIPTASSQDALLNFNTRNAVHRTDTENKTNTYSTDKQHDANSILNINNSPKYATKTTTVSTNKSTVPLMEGSLNIGTDTANDNLVSTTENKSNKTENNISSHAILDDLNLTTHITQNTKIPVNLEIRRTVPLVNVESVYDVTGSFGQTSESVKPRVDSTLPSIVSSGHEENFKEPNISIKDRVTFAAVTVTDDIDTTNVIYNLSKIHETDYSISTAENINKTNSFGAINTISASKSNFTENTTDPSYVIPGNFVSVETLNDLNSSTHVSNQDTKATTKIESSTSSVANVQSSNNTESTKIYLLAESGVTNTNIKESKILSTVEMSTLPPVVTVAVPVLSGQTDLKPAISTSPTSRLTDNKATKKVIDESHFAEKESSVTETNIPTLRDTSSSSYASKAIYTSNTNANTQSFIKNIHKKVSSVNNGFNVMQEGTTKDVINGFNKNNNVISTLQTSPPISSKTNSYKDSNTIATIHKSPSQFSTSHVVETAHSVKYSTSASGQVSNENPLINIVFNNNNNTNIQPITSLVINETNWNNKIDLNLSNSTKPSTEKSLLQQNSNNKPQQHSHDNSNSNIKRSEVKFNCNHHRRGRYADQDNCRKFYICIGRLTPIVGECPANTVFSEHTKQCTKNLSHCVRGNQFHCETSGRFSDLTQQSVYYICVKNKLDSYVRFKFQCQEGYSLNKETVRCIETEPERSISNDNESENENERKRNRYDHKNEQRREREKDNESENERKRNRYDHKNEQRTQRINDERDSEDEKSESKEFECEEEGKFAHADNCRQYYKCSKNRRSEYRRRIKSCDSDELFDESKKKCVDAESYECQRK